MVMIPRVDVSLKRLGGSDGADQMFLKATVSAPGSIYTPHQRSTSRVLQRSIPATMQTLAFKEQLVCTN